MLKLTSNKVAIQGIFDSDISPGGIIIPDIAKERCDQGVVKYIGPAVKDVKIGDYVLFGGYDGTTIRLEGEGALILMRESAIKCVIKDIDTVVDGLYLKGKSEFNLSDHIYNIVHDCIDDDPKSADIFTRKATQDIMNEFARYIGEVYFSAPYESVIQLAAQAMSEQAILHNNKYTNRDDPLDDVDDD